MPLGEFEPDLGPALLVSATIALGHAAGADMPDRMSSTEATAALRHSIPRVFGRRS